MLVFNVSEKNHEETLSKMHELKMRIFRRGGDCYECIVQFSIGPLER